MKNILLYSAFIFLPGITFAGLKKDGNRDGAVSEYIKQHITPVIAQKRQAFDVLLSATEKNELASIREELQQLHENRKAAMLQRSEEATDGNIVTHVRDEARHEDHAKMKELMEQVHIIADRHSGQLDEIFNALAPQQAQWKSDIAQIAASKKSQEEAGSPCFSGNGYAHYGMGGRNKMWSRSGFLLLYPSTPSSSNNDRQAVQMNDLAVPASMNIFPNPATDQFSLNLTGLQGENKLIVTDMTGKIIMEKENLTPSAMIACNNLSNGIYFVRLSTLDQTINQRLIISH